MGNSKDNRINLSLSTDGSCFFCTQNERDVPDFGTGKGECYEKKELEIQTGRCDRSGHWNFMWISCRLCCESEIWSCLYWTGIFYYHAIGGRNLNVFDDPCISYRRVGGKNDETKQDAE